MEVLGYLADNRETEPVEAVVVHRIRDTYVGVRHRVLDSPDGGAPLLMGGELLTHEAVRDLSLRLSGSDAARQVLPACVLVADSDLVAWWRPAVRRPIFFATADRALNAELDGRVALHPPLLFIGRPGALSVYALAEEGRPDGHSALRRAPYYNLFATGSMCPGTAPLPEQPRPTADCLRAYEAAFYDSSFVHTNQGQGALVRWPGGHAGFWRSMAASDHRFFPTFALVPLTCGGAPLTLGKVVNTHASKLLVESES